MCYYQLIVRQVIDECFSRYQHLVALELKLVEVQNFKMRAEHAFYFIDRPSDRDVNLQFSFCINYTEMSGLLNTEGWRILLKILHYSFSGSERMEQSFFGVVHLSSNFFIGFF